MKKQFQSKTYPQGTRTLWRYLGALFILFTFAVGNVMAAESATNNPATVEYGTGDAKKTFLNVSNTVSNTTIKTGSVACVTYGLYEMDKNWKPAFYAGPANGSSSSYDYSNAADYGFMAGSSAGSGTAANKSATSGYGAAKLKSDAEAVLYVTGITGIAVMGKDADTKNEKRLYIKVEEYAANGTCTPVGTGGGITKSSYNKSLHITTFDAGTLSGTKYYKVTLYAGYSTNHETSQIRFTKYIAPATSHTVTYKSGDGSGDDVVDDDATVVGGCPSTFSYTGYDFAGWKDGDNNDVEVGDAVTSDMTLTAQWTVHVAKYTVKYMDGTTLLGTEEVNVTEHPAGLAENPKKDCYTFAAWSPALSSVSGSEGDEIEVNATWTPKYASTLDFAAVTTAGTTGSNPIGTFLASGNMVASNLGGDSGWETSTAKSGFIGYKVKNTNAVIKFLVKAGKEVEITLGSVGAAAKLNKGGVESEIAKKSGDNEQTVIPAFVAESDMLVTITTNASSNSTVTLKKISIVDPAPKYTVTYALNGATGTTPTEVSHKEGEKFNLHDGVTGVTAPTNKTFVNWKDQDDNEFAGGAEYTMPAKNVTLTAQWAGDVYTVKFMDGETVLDTKVVEVGSHPADIEHPTKPLYTFAAWQLSGSDVVLDNVNGTKDATVILTARWAVAYASNVNFKEAATQALGVETALNTYHYASDAGDISFEEKGLKIKTNAARFYFNVAPGKVAEIKFGNISGATYSVDGGAAETLTSSQLKATYSASAQSCVMTMTTAAYNIVENVVIHDPYQVSYDPHGADAIAAQYGTPSVTLPTPANGTGSFLGWFTAETGGTKVGEAGDTYTPTANITLHAQWEAISTDARLASITFSSNAGTLSPAFDPEVVNYTYTMPYKTAAIPTITGATSVNANAQTPIIGDAATAWGGSQTIKGVAQSGDKKTYTITMQVAPKDGISLIKVATTGGTNKTVTGVYAGEGDVNLSSSKKMDKGKYIGFTLNGTALQAGDKINVHTTQASSAGNSHIIFYNNMTDKNALYDTEAIGGVGDNIFTINADMVGAATAYVYRASDNAPTNWNGYVDYIEATRVVMPTLTAITIDGRDGEIDALDDTHFTVTIPYESVLTSLTVVPTVIRNAAHATTPEAVITNEGAWVIGDNTYRVMDKDGDYTDYTITVARDVLKYPVKFYDGSTLLETVEVENGENLAVGDVPADPEKEDYLFQGWAETDGGTVVDVTSFTISAEKKFYAVWASDGGIKLLNGSTVNTTNFITGVTASKVTISETEYNCVTFAGTVSAVNNSNMKELNRHITYNATTTQTKVRLTLYNSNGSNKRTIYVKGVVEGTDNIVDLAAIELNGGEQKTTDYIEFNNANNRSIYIFVSSNAGDIKILQEKVIESGSDLKKAGESGYSLNMNKGRMFGAKDATIAFEGLTYTFAGDYTPVASEVLKVKSSNIVFTVNNPTLMKVTTANDKTYYVTKDAAGTDNETAKTGVSEFDLTAGTWYITAGASEVQFTKIEFIAPKCEQPTVADMADVDLCAGVAFTALTVSASVSDEGTLHYAWFKEAGETDEAVGDDAATYTPEADGQYYVIVTNQKDNYTDNSKTSNTITVKHFAAAVITTAPEDVVKEAGQEATLSVVASGKNCTYEWFACDDALGTNPVAFIPAETGTSLTVTVAAGEQYYMVVVSSDCGEPVSAVAKVSEWRELTPANVTSSVTWDWNGSAWAGITGSIAFANTGVEELMANVSSKVPVSDAGDFRADMLYGTGQYVWRSDNKFFQGTKIRFITEVPGFLTVHYRNTSGNTNTRKIEVVNNGETLPEDGTSTTNSWKWTNKVFVQAGEVILNGIASETNGLTRIDKIVFNATPDYSRTVSNNIGTLCVDHNVPAGQYFGATFYQIASRNEIYNDKIDFEEVLPTEELKAGEPYIFQSTTGRIDLFYADGDAVTTPVVVRGMHGVLAAGSLEINEANKMDVYYIEANKLRDCSNLSSLTLVANRAYIVMSEVPTYAEYQEAQQQQQNPAPRRRVTLGKNAEQTATGMDQITNEQSQMTNKVIIDGRLYILRGEKMYDATGRLVK